MQENEKAKAAGEGTKARLRGAALCARRAMGEGERAKASGKICLNLAESGLLPDEGIVLSFMAMPDEPDLAALEGLLGKERLAYPRTFKDGRMEAVAEADGFSKGAFGIREPVGGRTVRPEELAAVIVPCAGFSGDGHRVGMGGGYYDRYLPEAKAAVKVIAAFSAQRIFKIEPEAHDVPAEYIVTEEGWFKA